MMDSSLKSEEPSRRQCHKITQPTNPESALWSKNMGCVNEGSHNEVHHGCIKMPLYKVYISDIILCSTCISCMISFMNIQNAIKEYDNNVADTNIT